MAAAAVIQVTGLKELRKSLRGFETDANWRPALRNAYTDVAQMTEVAARASAGGSRMGGAARATIIGKGTTTKATLKGGSGGVPWFVGHNFGSRRFRQFPVKTTPDYHLYATIEKNREQVQSGFLDAIDRELAGEGL
jgi:hypothetical protein